MDCPHDQEYSIGSLWQPPRAHKKERRGMPKNTKAPRVPPKPLLIQNPARPVPARPFGTACNPSTNPPATGPTEVHSASEPRAPQARQTTRTRKSSENSATHNTMGLARPPCGIPVPRTILARNHREICQPNPPGTDLRWKQHHTRPTGSERHRSRPFRRAIQGTSCIAISLQPPPTIHSPEPQPRQYDRRNLTRSG